MRQKHLATSKSKLLERRSCWLFVLALCGACSTLGSEGGGMRDLPAAGIGPFGLLGEEELGDDTPLPDADGLVARGVVIQPSANEEPVIFYTFSAFMREHGEYTLGPQAIYRANAATEPTFEGGSMVLRAQEPWEGDEIFDPWPLELPDGRIRLYYAAAGGIGSADSDAVDGTFVRASEEALLTNEDVATTEAPASPSVVKQEDGSYVMFFSADGKIFKTRSNDAERWNEPVELDLSVSTSGAITDAFKRSPAATRVQTPSGRWVTHLFFEAPSSVELMGEPVTAIAVAASLDNVTFERSATFAFFDKKHSAHAPSAWVGQDGATLLYFAADAAAHSIPITKLRVAR